MGRKSIPISLEERGGDQFMDLTMAQQNASLEFVASNLVNILQVLLDNGELVICGGKLNPKPNREE